MKVFSACFILLSMFHLCTNQECNEVLQDVLKQVKTLEKSIKKLMYKRGMNESPVFEGTIEKADPDLATPVGLMIKWFNFLESDKVRDGTAWSMVTKSRNLTSADFTIEMDITSEELYDRITTHPDVMERWLTRIDPDDPDELDELQSFRLAMGIISGHYEGRSEENRNLGPNGEMASADVFAVFYKNGTFNFNRPDCAWYNQLPQGFSCGKGAEPIRECNRGFERYEPVPCHEIVLKIAIDRCLRGDIETRNQPDCITYVNWT